MTGSAPRKESLLAKIGKVLFILAGLYLFVAFFADVTINQGGSADITTQQVLKDGWGFDPSESYPLQTGGPVNGSSGSFNATTWFSLFSGGTNVSGNITPATAIRLGLQNNGISYILVLPTSEVRFHIVDGNTYAHFTIKNDVVDTVDLPPHGGSGSFLLFTHRKHWGQPNLSALSEWPGIKQGGIIAYLQSNIVSADLYVPRRIYDAYLNN